MAGLAGSTLKFSGGFVLGQNIEWDPGTSDCIKTLPANVMCLLVSRGHWPFGLLSAARSVLQ